MCRWTITSRAPQADSDPVFDPNFNAHMKGRQGRSKHTGLHTLIEEDLFQIKDDRKDQDDDCPVIYRAKVRLGSKDKYDKVKWDLYKLSTFFPDDMCLREIKAAVKSAWKNYKGLKVSSNKGHQSTLGVRDRVKGNSSVKWVGQVEITHPTHGAFDVLIGSLQTGDSPENRIYNAFPAINGRFFS